MELVVKFWEFFLAFLKELVSDGWQEEDLKALRARREEVLALLRGTTTPAVERGMGLEAQLARWQGWYQKHFGLTFAMRDVKLPERKRGFDRLIVVHPGITYAKLIKFFRSKFNVSFFIEDLDAADVIDCCKAEGAPYGIWVRAGKEADKENRNKSADQFSQQECETLLERLLHELCYFLETGEHLDVLSWTICAGSRNRLGKVPRVYWYSDYYSDYCKLYVRWYLADNRNSRHAVRSVVR